MHAPSSQTKAWKGILNQEAWAHKQEDGSRLYNSSTQSRDLTDLRTCLDLAEISEPNQHSHKDSWYLKAIQSHLSECARAAINSLRAATSKCNYTASRYSSELWSLQGCTQFGPTVSWEGQHLDSCSTPNGGIQFNISKSSFVCLYAYVCVAISH